MKPPHRARHSVRHRAIASLAALAALAATVAGCAAPYSPRYGSPQAYSSPAPYPAAYSFPPAYAYGAGPRYAQASDWNAYRNYNGIHPGPEVTFSVNPGPRAYYP